MFGIYCIFYTLFDKTLECYWHFADNISRQVPDFGIIAIVDLPSTLSIIDGIDNNLTLHDHLIGVIPKLMHIEYLEHVVLIVQHRELQWLYPFYRLLVNVFGWLRCGFYDVA